MKKITAKEFDRMVEEGEDLSGVLIPTDDSAGAPAGALTGSKPIKLDLPVWLLVELDKEAKRRNVPRKALINMWLADRVDSSKKVVG